MQPDLHLGPLTLKTFGISFALAFVAIGLVLARRLRELGKPVDWAYEITFAALLGGIVGARGYYLVQNWDQVGDDLLGNVVSGAGLVWYGGVIGGALAVHAFGLLDDRADELVAAQPPEALDAELRGDRVQVGEWARLELRAIEDGHG